jgi:hypothetical protein
MIAAWGSAAWREIQEKSASRNRLKYNLKSRFSTDFFG